MAAAQATDSFDHQRDEGQPSSTKTEAAEEEEERRRVAIRERYAREQAEEEQVRQVDEPSMSQPDERS